MREINVLSQERPGCSWMKSKEFNVLIKCLSSITVNLRHQAAFLKKLANKARHACLENYHTLPRLFLSRFAVERNNRKTLATLQNQSVLRVEVVECSLPGVIKGVCNQERDGIGW